MATLPIIYNQMVTHHTQLEGHLSDTTRWLLIIYNQMVTIIYNQMGTHHTQLEGNLSDTTRWLPIIYNRMVTYHLQPDGYHIQPDGYTSYKTRRLPIIYNQTVTYHIRPASYLSYTTYHIRLTTTNKRIHQARVELTLTYILYTKIHVHLYI